MNTLFTPEQFTRLKDNGVKKCFFNRDNRPVAFLSYPDLVLLGETKKWLVSAIIPACPDYAYGIYDDCTGFPKLQYLNLDEIATLKHPVSGDTVYNDTDFEGKYSLAAYIDAALDNGEIITDNYLVSFYHKEFLEGY